MQATRSLLLVKSPFSKIFHLDFLRHTRLSTGEPRGLLGGPSEPENGQTSYNSSDIPFFHLSCKQSPVFPLWNHPIVKWFLNFSWHTRLSTGIHFGPSGALGRPFRANMQQIIRYFFDNLLFKKCLVLPYWNNPIVKYFSFHTRLSIVGAPQSQKTAEECLKLSNIPWSIKSHGRALIVPKGRPSLPLEFKNRYFLLGKLVNGQMKGGQRNIYLRHI